MATPRGSLIVTALAVIASAFVLAGSALAASKSTAKKMTVPTEPPMRVYIVRSGQDGCEPNCPEWIAAQGRIEAGSLGRLKNVLNQLGRRNLPILVHSGGGMADEALAMGRLLRAKGLDVGVGKTLFTSCPSDDAACLRKQGKKPLRGLVDADLSVCASSCAFILAAGTRRFVGLLSLVGVHRSILIQAKVLQTYKNTPYRASDGSVKYKRKLIAEKVVSTRQVSAPQKTYERYEKYFAEMGIGKEIMPLMLGAQSNSIHWMTRDELYATRIATHRMNGGELIHGATVPGDGWAGPLAPIITSPELSSPTPDCPRNGSDCSWQLAPSAPADHSSTSSTTTR